MTVRKGATVSLDEVLATLTPARRRAVDARATQLIERERARKAKRLLGIKAAPSSFGN